MSVVGGCSLPIFALVVGVGIEARIIGSVSCDRMPVPAAICFQHCRDGLLVRKSGRGPRPFEVTAGLGRSRSR